MPEQFAHKTIFFFFVVTFLSCGTVRIYKEPDRPVLISNEINNIQPADSLTVVSFNIEKAEKIQQAISELQRFAKTTPVAVYLLQEMDEQGVQAIAKELNLNYLYIPIVYNWLLKKNMGNAILAKGLIQRPEKLILPHTKWINGRRRHVTIGEVTLGDKKILVYSVHTETSTMGRKKRTEQWDAILEHAQRQLVNYPCTVIGGDFNTLFPKDAGQVVEKFRTAGFGWATAAAGHTARAFYGLIKPREDYIFYTGLQALSGGKIESSKVSDHYPVYATFRCR